MTPAAFERTLGDLHPPSNLAPALAALWWAARGDWDKAHKIVMDDAGADCAWVHAYLHRVEGDLDNAGYWYRQARRAPASGEFRTEWAGIVATLLAAQTD